MVTYKVVENNQVVTITKIPDNAKMWYFSKKAFVSGSRVFPICHGSTVDKTMVAIVGTYPVSTCVFVFDSLL